MKFSKGHAPPRHVGLMSLKIVVLQIMGPCNLWMLKKEDTLGIHSKDVRKGTQISEKGRVYGGFEFPIVALIRCVDRQLEKNNGA